MCSVTPRKRSVGEIFASSTHGCVTYPAVDLGCGFGRLVIFLKYSTNANISGYELDQEAVKMAKKKQGK